MTQISFTAQYIDKLSVLKRTPNGNYKKSDLSLVKLDADNPNDLNAINKILQNQETYYLKNVYDDLLNKKSPNYIPDVVLLLTEQNKGFQTLDETKIYGYCNYRPSFRYKKMFYVDYLETLNKSSHGNPDRKYKGIGSAFLTYLKTITNKFELYAVDSDLHDFYLNNGLKFKKKTDMDMYWKKSTKKFNR